MKYYSRIPIILLLTALLLTMAACDIMKPEETVPPTEDPNTLVTELTLVAENQADLTALDIYPNLAALDLRGSTCYDAIFAYMDAHPHVKVTYDVTIGDSVFEPETTVLTLKDGSFGYQQLVERIGYLTQLEEIMLPGTTLSGDELRALTEACPDLTVHYTVFLGDQEISGDTTELDLSHLDRERTEEIIRVLPQLIRLTDVQLMDEEGESAFEISDVKLMMDALAGVNIHYSFELFGKTLSTMDERVEYVNKKIGDKGVEQVRQALDILPKCTYFLMDRCSVANEVMAQLRDDYPDVKIVWRIYYADTSCLTDVTVFRCVDQLHNGNSKQLKYCTDVVYMDIGHSYNLADLSFVSYMPNLKVAIVADCFTKTLEPFAACKNLQWIEIVNCVRLKDLSPLANCTNLRGVNMSYTFGIDDLSPLYELEHLERLFLGRHDLPQETIDEARAALPGCWVTDKSEDVAWIGFNYSVGWRLDDEHTFADWYLEIKEVFGYNREI